MTPISYQQVVKKELGNINIKMLFSFSVQLGINIVFHLTLLQLKDGKGADDPIKIKISGDGAKMSHTSNLFVFSFSLLDDGQSYLSSSGMSQTTHSTIIDF